MLFKRISWNVHKTLKQNDSPRTEKISVSLEPLWHLLYGEVLQANIMITFMFSKY
jgi:hypothetical protein